MTLGLGDVDFVDPVLPRAARVPAAAPSPLEDEASWGDLADLRVDGDGRAWRLAEVLEFCEWTSLLVLRGGALVAEAYAPGVGPGSLLLGASASKSALAHLVGRAVTDGRLDLDAPVAEFAPELPGWAGVPVRDVLAMTSGAAWVEDHRDPAGPASRLVGAAFSGTGSMRGVLAEVGRAGPPGERWEYSTADSQVLDLVRERATGLTFADDLARLWADLGCERDAAVVVDGDGTALAGGGLAACARDWACLGLLQLDGRGTAAGPLLDPDWLTVAARPAAPFTRPGRLPSALSAHVGFGGHWWPLDDAGSCVAADGSRGQFVVADTRVDTVVVLTCRWAFADAWHDRRCRDLAYLALDAVTRSAGTR